MGSSSVIAHLVGSLTVGRVAGGFVIFLVGSFVIDIWLKPRYSKALPRVGYGESTIATLRNWVGYMTHFGEWLDEGYEKYSKGGRAFVVPSALSRPQEIVVPRSQTAWMLELPDRVLSTEDAQNEVMYGEYNFLGRPNSDDGFHIRLVHRNLARHLPELIPGIEEEVEAVVEAAFGTDTENWTSVNLWDAWMGMVPPVINRVLVGKPVCRNADFLKSMVYYVDAVVTNSLILNMFPKILLPIVGRLVTLANWRHWKKTHDIILPVIAQRLDDMAKKDAGDSAYEKWEPPEDFITWDIRTAKAEGRMSELDPTWISKRMLPVEFAAIHTTVITGHFLMMDLLSAEQSRSFLDTIREETARVLREEGGHWTKNGLSRLLRTDSAIRESQRVSNFAKALTRRKVTAKDGIQNPTEGWHAPCGGFLMLNLASVHHDAELFPNPTEYDPFRYSRVREEYEARPQELKSPEEGMRVKQLGMVTTSDSHLAFGHGRHACPGRFFVAHKLKIVMAVLLKNYEIKPLAERPRNQWLGQTIIPPLGVKVEVRRRKDAV